MSSPETEVASGVIHPAMVLGAVDAFPRQIREIENIFIELSDGCRLAARIWMPLDADTSPVPAILEYLPYRKRDATAERDALMHPYVAGHGYASVRVDMRGSGESDGLLADEYLKQEQDDALEVIAWLARQPWCTGAVGMIGISWGGFNGLQLTALRPPALKAIITLCSTDDRYADDTHYMGGALLGANLTWASTMLANQSRPPDPLLVGDRWREMWLDRLRNMPMFHRLWLEHQHRDAYWRHGSVCEDFDAIECPVYAVGGWDDSYTNAIPRLLARLKGARKGLIGPWAHRYPHVALPGPQIGFIQECLRWWDKWLKGIETGIMDEPMLRAWIEESVRPAAWYGERPGRWISEPSWPSSRIHQTKKYLTSGGLADSPLGSTETVLASPETAGAAAGMWCPHGMTSDDPTDQREDDAKSLTFDTPPLAERLELLGAPVLELQCASNRPDAKLCVRLCNVHPDGTSTRISYGILNLTHRDSHSTPALLEPDQIYSVRIQLNDLGYAIPPGHRIRVALSSAYWPLTWPSPEPVRLVILAGPASITLPIRPPQAEDSTLEPFGPPEAAPPERRTTLKKGGSSRTQITDIETGRTTFLLRDDEGSARIDPHGLEVGSRREHKFSISPDDPLSAQAETSWTKEIGRGDWRTRAKSHVVMTSTREEFFVEAHLRAYEGDQEVYSKDWNETIKRNLV